MRAAADRPGWSIDARSGCRVWSATPQPDETVTWSGGCDPAGRASGRGTLEWRFDGRVQRFDGELREGKLNGRGVLTLTDGRRYDGEFRDGLPNGHGVLAFRDGRRYEGEFRDNKLEGHGVATSPDGRRYEGEFRDGQPNGHGVLTFPDGRRHEGEFRDGQANGRGIVIFPNGRRFEAEFREGKASDRGSVTFANGDRYEGELRDGWPNGHGVFTLADGRRYEGDVRDGQANGRGVETFPDGRRYEGEFRDGQPNGRGVLTFVGGRYDGEFHNGRFNGHGILTTPDGIRYEGRFQNGQRQSLTVDVDLTWLMRKLEWVPKVKGWDVAFIFVSLVLSVLIIGVMVFLIRWLIFLPGDRGGLDPKDRRRIALSGTLGSSFGAMLLAAALYFSSLDLDHALTEGFAITLVAVALVAFLEPLFERLRAGLGIAASHAEKPVRLPSPLAKIGLAILLLNGILHTLLHEFIKEYPGLSTVLVAGWGPVFPVIITYCWMLGWHPDPARSRAARRGAVSGAVFGLAIAWSWVPYLAGTGKFVAPVLGVLMMTIVPFAGGLAMDKGWGWGMGWQSYPSLSMMTSMLVAWFVVGGLYWLWVLNVEDNLSLAFVTLGLPIPTPTLAPTILPGMTLGNRSLLCLSAPFGIRGWGLGLLVSRFDMLVTARRLEERTHSDIASQEVIDVANSPDADQRALL